jgi:hypothetical protein
VRDLLNSLKSDPRNGIAEILERDAIKQRGAFPGASFLVVMKLGYSVIGDATSALVSEVTGTIWVSSTCGKSRPPWRSC